MKRNGGLPKISDLLQKKAKTDERIATTRTAASQHANNPFMKRPVELNKAIYLFLQQSHTEGRNLATGRGETFPLNKPLIEIEARVGIVKSPSGLHDQRVLASGAKTVPGGAVASSFWIQQELGTKFVGGVTRSHFTKWTAAGWSEPSPLSMAFGLKGKSSEELKAQTKSGWLRETELVETVYGGYPNEQRLCYPGDHTNSTTAATLRGKMEQKKRLPAAMDLALPAAPYDVRLGLATETIVDENVSSTPPPGHSKRRLKRRRSYTSKKFAWQMDVTEVASRATTTEKDEPPSYEIEFELLPHYTMKLLNESDKNECVRLFKTYADQLCFMLNNINPSSDVLDVDTYIIGHTDHNAVSLALAQCVALRRYLDSKQWQPAITGTSSETPNRQNNHKFIGCMPVNFSRHNIETVQRATGGYYLSEKTDGVRYLMVFTGTTVVLVDRAGGGNQPKSATNPWTRLVPLVQPGTVFDGEVVMHRKQNRPIFIVFDVMCCGNTPVLHLNFEQRLQHLLRADFKTSVDPFCNVVADYATAGPLPLVRKSFCRRIELDRLLSRVTEERGQRTFGSADGMHCHLTDGIIFQPNLPYRTGTDVNLLKWKYLDTVTIDVEILPPRQQHYHSNNNDDEEDVLRLGVLGDEGSRVDMTRYIRLPTSERLRLEADREETKAKICEVGFDPETGEWYYLTMRPDKIASNHISTVLGTLLELAESLDTTELRYRMSVRSTSRDTYRKDVRGMMKQLLGHQRKSNANIK